MFDYQKVRVIAYTQPTSDIHDMKSPQDIIAWCARVSNPKNQGNTETAEKLLNYCIDHKHWSIFEMVNVVIEINTTRDIGRQILRHRSFHFQEFSQRYANPINEGLQFQHREARLQDNKNRQNSITLEDNDPIHSQWEDYQSQILSDAEAAYYMAIDMGIAKEQARALLPEGLTMSRMYMSGTLRDWIHYCQLRMGVETQKEHRDIAAKCWNELVKIYPFLETIK